VVLRRRPLLRAGAVGFPAQENVRLAGALSGVEKRQTVSSAGKHRREEGSK